MADGGAGRCGQAGGQGWRLRQEAWKQNIWGGRGWLGHSNRMRPRTGWGSNPRQRQQSSASLSKTTAGGEVEGSASLKPADHVRSFSESTFWADLEAHLRREEKGGTREVPQTVAESEVMSTSQSLLEKMLQLNSLTCNHFNLIGDYLAWDSAFKISNYIFLDGQPLIVSLISTPNKILHVHGFKSQVVLENIARCHSLLRLPTSQFLGDNSSCIPVSKIDLLAVY